MRQTLPSGPLASVAIAAVAAAVLTAPAAAHSLHFELARSVPAAGATVENVSEVRLWFTEAPQDSTVAVHLIDAEGDLLDTPAPAPDPEDEKVRFVPLPNGLTSGHYTVAWRGMGDDGHVVRGEFAFSVTGD